MVRVYQLAGFRYGVIGIALLLAALGLFFAADMPRVTSIYNSTTFSLPVTGEIRLVKLNATPKEPVGLVKLRVWVSDVAENVSKGFVDIYYVRPGTNTKAVYVESLNLSRGYTEVYIPPTEAVGFICRDCYGEVSIAYNYSLYRVSKPYFALLWPGIAAMILGIVLGILGLVYISLEAKLLASKKGRREQ